MPTSPSASCRGRVAPLVLAVCAAGARAVPVAAQGAAHLPPPPVDVRAPLRGPDSLRLARLAAVGRAWVAARLFHPWLVQPSPEVAIDWDSALVGALPAIRAAGGAPGTRAEYARAVTELFAALRDPATRVVAHAPAPPAADVHPAEPTARTVDGALVVTVGHPDQMADQPSFRANAARLLPQLAVARAVVFDLRTAPGTRAPEYLAYLFRCCGLGRGLNIAETRTPAARTWAWAGYPSDAGGYAGYGGGWRVDGGVRIPADTAAARAAAAGTPAKRVAFLVNVRTAIPASALALRDAGLAMIVAEGGASDAGFVPVTRLALDDSTDVELRTGELVWSDGRAGFAVDTVVAAARTPTGDTASGAPSNDSALSVAVRWTTGAGAPAPLRLPRPGFATAPPPARAYPEMAVGAAAPALEWRLLAAFRLWGTMEYFHAYRHLYDDDWYAVLKHLLPRFETAADGVAYERAVQEFAHHVHDSHAVVYAPRLGALTGWAVPPVVTRMLGDTMIVTRVLDDSAARAAGVRVGDVIAAVDGIAPRTFITRSTHTLAASNAWTRDRDLGLALLRGPDGSEAALVVDGRGGRRTVRLPRRNAYALLVYGKQRVGTPVWRSLTPDVGYMDLDRLTPPQVDSAFNALAATQAIVFDLRGYPNVTFPALVQRLSDRRSVPMAWFGEPRPATPRHRPEDGSGDEIGENNIGTYVQALPGNPGACAGDSAEHAPWRGLAVVLVDERTQSQAEHTVLAIAAAAARTRIVGAPSAGTDGDVTSMALPGAVTVSFSGHDVRWPDGRPLQRVGLSPNRVVRPTVRGVRAGQDEVLKAGLADAAREIAGAERHGSRGAQCGPPNE